MTKILRILRDKYSTGNQHKIVLVICLSINLQCLKGEENNIAESARIRKRKHSKSHKEESTPTQSISTDAVTT